jgi:hypothetical protein
MCSFCLGAIGAPSALELLPEVGLVWGQAALVWGDNHWAPVKLPCHLAKQVYLGEDHHYWKQMLFKIKVKIVQNVGGRL